MKTDRGTPRPRRSVSRTAGWFCSLLILLIVYGCNGAAGALPEQIPPAGETQPTPLPPQIGQAPTASQTELMPQVEIPPVAEPTPTETTRTEPTLQPPTAEPLVCEAISDLGAVFVADLGLADSTAVPPDAPFRKIWRVRNTGTCMWPEGVQLVRVSGDTIPGPDRVPAPAAAPGQEIDVAVDLTAPKQPARYTSFWRFQTAGGDLFGAVVYLEIVVSVHANPPPIHAIPSPTSFPTASPTPPTTSMPTATSDASPTEQQPTAVSAAPCGGIDPRFGPLIYQVNQLGLRIPCVSTSISTQAGWLQVYWQEIDQSSPPLRLRSLVIVRNDTRTIYVLDGKDAVTYRAAAYAYQNTWIEGMPERDAACAPLIPPPGYTDPTHGIGRVWCEESLWNTIGWPDEPAHPATLAIQGESTNMLIEVTTEAATYLITVDLQMKEATVYQTR